MEDEGSRTSRPLGGTGGFSPLSLPLDEQRLATAWVGGTCCGIRWAVLSPLCALFDTGYVVQDSAHVRPLHVIRILDGKVVQWLEKE